MNLEGLIAKTSIAAHKEREEQRKQLRKEQDERRQREEEEKDQNIIEEVVLRSPLHEWFPDVTWVLVDRKFSQEAVVVRPEDDDDLFFKVTLVTYKDVDPPKFMIQMVSPGDKHPTWIVRANVLTVADIGATISHDLVVGQSKAIGR